MSKSIYYLYIHFAIFMSCVPRMLEFTKETLPKFSRILIIVQINVFSRNLQVCRYLGRYSWYPEPGYIWLLDCLRLNICET